MDKELFPVKSAREIMQQPPPLWAERASLFAKRIIRDGVTALGPSDVAGSIEMVDNLGAEEPEVWITDRKRHHPRAVQICGWDPMATPFWVNLVIAADGIGTDPDVKGKAELAKGTSVTKAYGSLPNAIRDLHALRFFYNPHRYGASYLVYPNGVGRSAGYFSHTVWLANPKLEQVNTGIESVCHWMDINSADPEFKSVQLNIYFSGHGSPGDAAGGSYVVIRNGRLRTETIVQTFLDVLSRYRFDGENLRISLFIDCCHAAAVAADFRTHLLNEHTARLRELPFRTIWCRSLFCSSLRDEQSFDEVGLKNSYFTAGFLKENSSKPVPKAYPDLTQVSIRSTGRQTPVLIRWKRPEDTPEVRVPAMRAVPDDKKQDLMRPEVAEPAVLQIAEATGRGDGSGGINLSDYVMCLAEYMRSVSSPYISHFVEASVPYEKRRSRWDR
ncbi:hypothetical protein [Bradyrhizobium iriomotense]|uniref:hypothetical protein n=1 Tax=Bradyrhizobium iriomotense TaxID=441950 RepID=UPI001B89F0A5|nr:hypothetical protein [Bradyrhizobium iriomotense]MBR1127382.1 hypothetical protein [Bradyrhizobium iriomotense]